LISRGDIKKHNKFTKQATKNLQPAQSTCSSRVKSSSSSKKLKLNSRKSIQTPKKELPIKKSISTVNRLSS
jgi:hypothetical protein